MFISSCFAFFAGLPWEEIVFFPRLSNVSFKFFRRSRHVAHVIPRDFDMHASSYVESARVAARAIPNAVRGHVQIRQGGETFVMLELISPAFEEDTDVDSEDSGDDGAE